ncbi:uncharacterized protein [Littorina saxatilis]|uniref:uncharacterized protein n=1 Tax=Littorina saxatilis TaxID=31220 RepID=UPI0038B5EBB2
MGKRAHTCVYDYIDVYAVDSKGYRTVLGRFCGNKLPAPITSPQSTLLIEFVSDYTKPSTGFFGHFTFLGDNWQPFDHARRMCGPGNMEGSGGIIQSPGYPRPFPPGVDCSWLVKVRDDEQILIMIDDLDIGTSAHCAASDSSLQIYYGYATNNTVPSENLCGQLHSVIAARKRERPSPSSRVVIRFITGPNNLERSRGFRLTWTAIHLPQEGPCPEFQCEGGYACGLEGLGGICDQLPRYCIHDDQRCNGIANCGQHDDSDERRCPREILIMTALIAVPSLAVITLVVLVIYCYRSKRVKKSASQNQPLTSTHKHGSSKESFNSHRSYQQCMMHTSFVDGGGGAGGVAGNAGGGASGTLGRSGGVVPGEAGLPGVMPLPEVVIGGAGNRLPGMEEPPPDIDDQQLQLPIPIPRPPDPNYRTHQKRASYTMMKQNFEDGNTVIAEI